MGPSGKKKPFQCAPRAGAQQPPTEFLEGPFEPPSGQTPTILRREREGGGQDWASLPGR